MRGRTAFTLIELLVVVSIIALLIAILLPSLGRAKEAANTMVCLTNLRTLFVGNMNYAGDYKSHVAPAWDQTSPYNNYSAFSWAFEMMPYLGYKGGSAWQYWLDTYHHGSIEIRSWVQNPPGVWKQYGYKSATDTTTKSTNPMFCPSTRGPVTWPNEGPYSGLPGYLDAYQDLAPNTFVSGIINPDGNWNSLYPGIRTGDKVLTKPTKLMFIGDSYGYFPRINNQPSNRHVGRTINFAFWDGHAANAPEIQYLVTGPNYNWINHEKASPGSRYYFYGR